MCVLSNFSPRFFHGRVLLSQFFSTTSISTVNHTYRDLDFVMFVIANCRYFEFNAHLLSAFPQKQLTVIDFTAPHSEAAVARYARILEMFSCSAISKAVASETSAVRNRSMIAVHVLATGSPRQQSHAYDSMLGC